MLTGDAPTSTEKIILDNSKNDNLESTVLKVGQHGSRASTSSAFVEAVSPLFALISDGRDNKYGHPHLDTLNVLTKAGIEILRTDLLGTIIMQSDGKNVSFSYKK